MLNPLKSVRAYLAKYIDVDYFLRFSLLLIVLYYGNLLYIAMIDKKGIIYFSFLDNHLNYINWIRNSILYPANSICHIFGVQSYVDLPYHLRTINGAFVETVYECLGIGLMSFWLAFVIADTSSFRKKVIWGLTGIVSIWVINCFRIAILLMAFESKWKVNKYADHHTLFNIVAYSILLLLIYFYLKASKKTAEKKPFSSSLLTTSS